MTNYVADTLIKDLFENYTRGFGKYCNEIYELSKCALSAANNTAVLDDV